MLTNEASNKTRCDNLLSLINIFMITHRKLAMKTNHIVHVQGLGVLKVISASYPDKTWSLGTFYKRSAK